jgi:nucleotide-binding universal stress UspA family protein
MQLPELATSKQAQQIVVGTHGRGALGRAILGSVSSFLTQNCDTPVTVVRTANAS